MADTQYYDVNGNPVQLKQQQYFDVQGNPIQQAAPIGSSGGRGGVPLTQQNIDTANKANDIKRPGIADAFRHFIGQYIPGLLPAGGAIGGALLGGGPDPITGAAGAGLGSAAGVELQNEAPRWFGQGPSSGAEAAGRIGGDIVGNSIIPDVGGALARGGINLAKQAGEGGLKAALLAQFAKGTKPVQSALLGDTINEGMKKLSSKIYPDSSIIETAAQNAQDNLNNTLNSGQSNPFANGGPFQGGTVGQKLTGVPYQQTDARVQSLSKIKDMALSDVTQVRNWKLATGETGTIRQLAAGDVINQGYSQTAGTIDPDKILKAFDGPKADVYNEAMAGSNTKQDIIDLANTIKDAQANMPKQSGLINYFQHRLTFDAAMLLPEAMMGAAAGHELIGIGAGVGTVVLTNSAITKMMANPVTAKAVIQAIKTPATSPMAPLLGKIIKNGLIGAQVLHMGPEGKLEQAIMGPDGPQTPQP